METINFNYNQMSVQIKQILFILSFLFLIPTVAFAQNNGLNLLFEISEQNNSVVDNSLSQALIVQSRKDVLQSFPITVDKSVLEQLRNKTVNSFQMNDVNGNLITIEVSRIIEHLHQDWSIIGSIDGNPFNSFTLSYSDGKLISQIRNITEHTFMEIAYRSESESHYLLEVDPHNSNKLSCGVDHSNDRLRLRRSSTAVQNLQVPQPRSTGTTVIDVMIVYTPAAEKWALSEDAGGVGIQNIINQSMTIAQEAVDNSNIDLEFRLVHSAKVDYTEEVKVTEDGEEENDSGVDLDKLTDGDIPGVHEWRDEFNADLVAMFTDVEDTGGIAYLGSGSEFDADLSYSITRVQQAANSATHVHEMGHNMGKDHSRNQKESASENGGIFEYSTGWRWIGNDGETYISVMSYDEAADDDENGKDENGDPIYGIEVRIFSNPDINFQGVPTGSYSGKYAPADNARSMREVMQRVSNHRVASGGGGDDDDDEPVDTSAKPENLTLQYGNDSVTLNWNAVNSGALTGYKIYRSTNSNNIQLYQSIDSNSTSFQDSPAETMFYAVSAAYGSDAESARSNITSFYKAEQKIGEDWDLISIPLKNSTSGQIQIVGFDQVYTRENSIMPGKGYWVRNNTEATLNISGEGFINGDITLNSGWNLIGGLSDNFLLSDISDPENILSNAQIFEYHDKTYRAVSGSLSPGKGFWMNAEESGTIRFQIPGTQSGKIQNSNLNRAPISGLHRLEFNSNGITQDFWISDKELHSDDLIRYLLPPMAPSGILDIRSEDNYMITDQSSQNIHLTSDSYPVVINFYKDGQISTDYAFRIVGTKGQDEIHFNLTGQQLEIPYPMDSLRLERVKSNDLITEFKLHSNYPNPFNPATNIQYELPQQSPVRIEVFDVVGRRIALLVDATQQSGTYTVQFDGNGIASGLYLLRFQAGRFNETRQITLIK